MNDRLRASCVAFAFLCAVMISSPALSQDRPVSELCLVPRWGPMQCLNVDELRRLLDAEEARALLAQLDRLVRGAGGRSKDDLLISCGGSPRLIAAAITPGTAPPPRSSTRDATRLAGQIGQCLGRIADYRGASGPAAPEQWIDQTVQQVTLDLSACTTSGTSPVADAGDTQTERKVKGVIDRTEQPPPAATSGSGVGDSALLVVGKQRSPFRSAEPATPAKWKEPVPSGVKRGTTVPCPAGTDCAPTCAERQATWDRFKADCDRSGWRAYPCVDFLRKVNGCVSVTEIRPGVDGDLTCPKAATPAERQRLAWEHDCRRRQMVSKPAPGGGAVCVERTATPPQRIDICNDPRAMPSDGQCSGGELRGTPGRPQPPANRNRPPGPG